MYVAMYVFDFVSSILLSSGGQQEQSSVEQMRMGGRSVEQEKKEDVHAYSFLESQAQPLIANNTS